VHARRRLLGLLLLWLLLLLLLLEVELGGGVEAVALGARGPRVGELGRVRRVGHMVEVQTAAEALLVVDGHGGHLRRGAEGRGDTQTSTGTPLKSTGNFSRHGSAQTQHTNRQLDRTGRRSTGTHKSRRRRRGREATEVEDVVVGEGESAWCCRTQMSSTSARISCRIP
jgi:hypothetical protein